MTRLLSILVAAFLCTGVALQGSAWGQAQQLSISCEGTYSGGGGARAYQYTLKNIGATPVTLTLFYLGTMDVTLTHFSNWTAPAGFAPVATVADWTTLFNLYGASAMSTTMLKTAHGVVPPPLNFPTFGGIAWSGSAVLSPNQQATFGFNNPHAPWDMEWFADHPGGANVSQGFVYLPIAGPMGVFTNGFVHGPGEQPVPVDETTFGRIKAIYGAEE
jgi:hypothetical protein